MTLHKSGGPHPTNICINSVNCMPNSCGSLEMASIVFIDKERINLSRVDKNDTVN